MAADVAGYSRLMGADETATLDELRRLRSEALGPAVAGRRGKIVKSMGDGWLIEFVSAADAVNCAMQVQDRLAGHSALRPRVGIHIGDVVHEGDDFFGSGINIAARLQELADSGGIYVSDLVYGALDGTLRPSFDDGGEHGLKNIERPLRIWVRAASAANRSDAGLAEPAALRRAGFPQLMIQPVATSDDRYEVRELADALTNDLDAYLGSVRWLLAETRDQSRNGAYRLRASLRAHEDRLRLEARLFAPRGEQLWFGKFDGLLAERFEWQDRVGEEVVANLLGLIMDSEHQKLAGVAPDQMTAEQCLLTGMLKRRSATPSAYADALAHFSRSIERNPELVEAYAEAIFMAIAAGTLGHRGLVERYTELCERWVEKARPFAARSAVLDVTLALFDYRGTGDPAPLRAKAADVLRRAPFDSRALIFCGWSLLWIGEARPALDCFLKHERIGRFDVYAAPACAGAAHACVQIGDDEAAIRHAKKGLDVRSDYVPLYRALAAAHAHLGQLGQATAALAEALRLVPGDTVSAAWSRNSFYETPGTRRYIEGLRKAGMPD